jgi:uncharacterized membrane protein
MPPVLSVLNRLFRFYYDGFRNMSWWGRRMWIIILIKLFVIFLILRLFFFHDFLRRKYSTDDQRSDYVIEQLINSK